MMLPTSASPDFTTSAELNTDRFLISKSRPSAWNTSRERQLLGRVASTSSESFSIRA
jgi:hypothetical protein